MTYDPTHHKRRSIRLSGYDYSSPGAYFITICTHRHECLFGDIVDGRMGLNDAGRMVQAMWNRLPIRFHHIELVEFTVMPNHVHGIMIFTCRGESCIRPNIGPKSNEKSDGHNSGDHKDRPYRNSAETDKFTGRPHGTLPNTLGRIVQAFKSTTTHEYSTGVKQSGWPPFPGKLWQRNYWEHIIRSEPELDGLREYIRNNPTRWTLDRLYRAP